MNRHATKETISKRMTLKRRGRCADRRGNWGVQKAPERRRAGMNGEKKLLNDCWRGFV